MDSEEDEEEGGSVETRRRRSRKIPEKACGLARLDVVKVSEDEDKLQPRGKKKTSEGTKQREVEQQQKLDLWKEKQTNKTTKKEKKK